MAAQGAEIPNCHGGVAALLEFGLPGENLQGAGRGVLAEEGALGAAQHLDTLYVHQVRKGLAGTAAVHAVYEGADGCLEPGVVAGGADPANAQGAAIRRAVGRIDGNAGADLLQAVEVMDAAGGEVLAGKGADRDGDVLDGLLPLGGRDHDFLQQGVAVGRKGCGGQAGERERPCQGHL